MRIWTFILKIGCKSDIDSPERARVMMLNGVMAVTSLSVIVFSVAYAIAGYRYFYGPLYLLPVAALVLLNNHLGKHARARHLYLAGSFLVVCYWYYEGRGNGNEYAFLGLATTSTLLYRTKIAVYLINFTCAVLFLVCKYLDHALYFVPDPAINYAVVPWIILLNTVGVITFQVVFFRDLAHHYANELATKYHEQAVLLDQQKTIETELKVSNSKLQDLTENLELKVKQKTAELQAYISAISMNTISTLSNMDGVFTEVNELVAEVSGYSRDELVGKHYSILASGRHPDKFFRDRRKILMGGKAWRGEVEHKTKEGSLLWFDCVVIPIRNIHGDIDSFLTLGLPITDRKLNEKIQKDTHTLLENIAFRASHDIRGPLARIKGLSDLILRDMFTKDEFKLIAEKLVLCSDELGMATSELVCFVHDHQELMKENSV